MGLPKLSIPVYDVVLPSGKAVTYRPFLVKEEKILLMASQSKDEAVVLKSILQILRNCVIDKIDIESLPVYDIEFLFLQLRAHSVGEAVELRYKCNKEIKGENGEETICGTSSVYNVDLLKIEPTHNPEHIAKIELSETVGLTLIAPKFSMLKSFNKNNIDDVAYMIDILLAGCIDTIYDENKIYYTKDTPKEELKQFIESLNPTQEKKIHKFFSTMPKIKHTIKFDCGKCGHKEDIVVEGLNNFFT